MADEVGLKWPIKHRNETFKNFSRRKEYFEKNFLCFKIRTGGQQRVKVQIMRCLWSEIYEKMSFSSWEKLNSRATRDYSDLLRQLRPFLVQLYAKFLLKSIFSPPIQRCSTEASSRQGYSENCRINLVSQAGLETGLSWHGWQQLVTNYVVQE